jgi:hypothetical protein
MALEVRGKVINILPAQSGEGRNGRWEKQEFVIETMDQYPKKICFSAWGDKTSVVKQLTVGEEITVSFNLESREYNQRWYTEARAWKIEKGEQSSGRGVDMPPISENDIPPENSEDIGLPF